MLIWAAIFCAQMVSSLLSTMTLYAAISASATRFVLIAALSDSIKLTVQASVAIQAFRGDWWGIAAAVTGGVVGNALAYRLRKGERNGID